MAGLECMRGLMHDLLHSPPTKGAKMGARTFFGTVVPPWFQEHDIPHHFTHCIELHTTTAATPPNDSLRIRKRQLPPRRERMTLNTTRFDTHPIELVQYNTKKMMQKACPSCYIVVGVTGTWIGARYLCEKANDSAHGGSWEHGWRLDSTASEP